MNNRLATLTVTVATAATLVMVGGTSSVTAASLPPGVVGTPTEISPADTVPAETLPPESLLVDAEPIAPLGVVTTGTTLDEFLYEITADVDAYWSGVWEAAERPMPYVNVEYPLPGEAAQTLCTESGLSDDNSAYYCPTDDTIVVSQQFASVVWNGAIRANPDITERYPTGDFSVAFVVAHEYAHALQAELGWITPTSLAYPGYKIELHADCWAGVWAHSAYNSGILEAGDVEEAVQTALDLGDYLVTDPGHHGTPAQRSGAFLAGYNGGTEEACSPYLLDVY
jgi:predicted metalloprotease